MTRLPAAFAVRTALDASDLEKTAGPAPSLVLRPLDGAGPAVRFDVFHDIDAARDASGELFERVAELRGRWGAPAGYAVFADWRVENPSNTAAFEESRCGLFELRRRHLRTFAADWLLKRVDVPGHYTVLGLYGDEEGLRLCRAHPEVQRYAYAHPPASFGAVDVTGMRFFRVDGTVT